MQYNGLKIKIDQIGLDVSINSRASKAPTKKETTTE